MGMRDDADLDGDFDGIDAQPLHQRHYRVEAYRNEDGTVLLRGAVRDRKPGNLFFPGDDSPVTVHHMVVDIVMNPDTFVINSARVVMETHPHEVCRVVEPHYDKLVGLSIARGFSAKVRELFGGPRGCTHTTALLLAMAPVAVQSMFSMQPDDGVQPVDAPRRMTEERRARALAYNLNTCHVWAEEGEMATALMEGEPHEFFPLWAKRRLAELGLGEEVWRNRFTDG
jgi:Protein of unknown function (DUF2889)